MFRCCLPCRGGSKAPATSSLDSENSATDPLYQCESIINDSGQQPKIYLTYSKHNLDADYNGQENNSLEQEQIQQSAQNQQSVHQQLLPHIEEEEESAQTTPEDEVSFVLKLLLLLLLLSPC